MYRRITHWSSRESFRWLCRVTEKDIQKSYDKCLAAGQFEPSRRADSMLGGLLIGQKGIVTVEEIIEKLSPFPAYYPDIPKLVKAFQANSNAAKGKRTPGMGWYTKDTCVEIHKLLLSAIVVYTNALRIFNNLPKRQVACGDQLWYAGYLLWRVTDSRIIRHHIRLLNCAHLLSYPTRGFVLDVNRDLDEQFGHITHEGLVELWVNDSPGLGADLGAYKEWAQNKEEEKKGSEEQEYEEEDYEMGDVTEDLDTEDQDDEDDDQTEEFLNKQDNSDLEKTYLRWMQLQSAYWIAQDIIMSPKTLSAVNPEDFKISIVNAKHPSNLERRMISWKKLIMELPIPESIKAPDVIATIKREIREHLKSEECHPIFKKYQPPSYKPRRFTGNLHAETLLVLFLRHLQAMGDMVWISSRSNDIFTDDMDYTDIGPNLNFDLKAMLPSVLATFGTYED